MMLFSNLYENYTIASSSSALVSVNVLRRYDNHFRKYWANSVFLLVIMKKNYWCCRTKGYNTLANISVPYYSALSKPLRQISDRHNISLTFTSNRNLRNILTKTKTQPPPHTTRNVIYQIPCKDCNATYCGQTRRPLHLRLSEHQRFTNNSKSFTSTDLQYTSAVAHHAHTTGHTIDFKSTHILSSLTKSSQLDLIEHAAIKIICPSLNKLHSTPNINNQWTDLLPTIKNSFRPRLAYPP